MKMFTSTLLIAAAIFHGALAAPQGGNNCQKSCEAALSGCLNAPLPPTNPNFCSIRYCKLFCSRLH